MIVDNDAFQRYREQERPVDHLSRVRGIQSFEDELDEYMDTPHHLKGIPLPWPSTHKHVRLRDSEMSTWSGRNGAGKSTLLTFLMAWAASMDQPVMIASFEMGATETLAKMCKQTTRVANPTKKARGEFIEAFAGKVFIYDHLGQIDEDLIIDLCAFSGETLGCKHIQIDSLTMINGMVSDDNQRQANFLNRLSVATRHYGIHAHLVAHERKGLSGGENRISSRYDIKGSGAISDRVDNCFIVWRNEKKARGEIDDPDVPDYILKVDKQRHGDTLSDIPLWSPQIQNYQFIQGKRMVAFRGLTREI